MSRLNNAIVLCSSLQNNYEFIIFRLHAPIVGYKPPPFAPYLLYVIDPSGKLSAGGAAFVDPKANIPSSP